MSFCLFCKALNEPGKEGFWFAFPGHSWSLREVRAGIHTGAWSRNHEGPLLLLACPLTCSVNFLTQARTTYLARHGASCSGLGPSRSVTTEDDPSAQVTLDCVKLIATRQQEEATMEMLQTKLVSNSICYHHSDKVYTRELGSSGRVQLYTVWVWGTGFFWNIVTFGLC